MGKRYLAAVLLLLFVAAGSGALMSGTGELFYRFPARGDFSVEEGAGGERLARRVLVVVSDGLARSGLAFMPYVRGLGRRGAFYTARTEAPSMSRVGYTVLSTGTKPEVHGVSSNEVKNPVRVGNVFRTARRAGLSAAFVGYSWWLDHFDGEIPLASVDNGLKAEDRLEGAPLPAGYIRRVLHEGRYVDLNARADRPGQKEHWRGYYSQRKLLDSFGDDATTPRKEDELRALETARIIREHAPDLIYMHLHSPDDEGHRTGSPHSTAYRKACVEVDRNVRQAAAALDLQRDTIIVTADHGFSDTIVDGGHGGQEDSSSLIPFVMAGAGVRAATGGRVRQLDIQPTVSVLLGLPFSSHIQGRPLLEALELDAAARRATETRYDLARKRFVKSYAKELGIDLDGAREDNLLEYFAAGKTRLRIVHYLYRFVPAAIVLLVALLLFKSLAPGGGWSSLSAGWIGPAAWIVYEVSFYAIYVGVWGEYSFSSFADPNENLAFMGATSVALLIVLSLASARWLRFEASPFSVMGFVFLAVLFKATIVFGFLGLGDPIFHPGGLVLFAGLSFYMQSLTAAAVAAGLLLLRKYY